MKLLAFGGKAKTVAALGILGLVVAACSPGHVVINYTDNTGTAVHLAVICHMPSGDNPNCFGLGTIVYEGTRYNLVGPAYGGMTGFNPDTYDSGPDCTSAPCSPNGATEFYGEAKNGSGYVYYYGQAADSDTGTNAGDDAFEIQIDGGPEVARECYNCVEVIMQPGSYTLTP